MKPEESELAGDLLAEVAERRTSAYVGIPASRNRLLTYRQIRLRRQNAPECSELRVCHACFKSGKCSTVPIALTATRKCCL